MKAQKERLAVRKKANETRRAKPYLPSYPLQRTLKKSRKNRSENFSRNHTSGQNRTCQPNSIFLLSLLLSMLQPELKHLPQ